jgi:glycine oxidase
LEYAAGGPVSGRVLIVGGGLAGTTLAWALHFRGQPFVLVDSGDPSSASRVAAGFVNPITGQRFALSWYYATFLAEAERFYAKIEAELSRLLFVRRPMARLFQNELERDRFQRKIESFGVATRELHLDEYRFAAALGGFELPDTKQLLVAEFLQASHAYFDERFQIAEVDPTTLDVRPDSVCVPEWNKSFRVVVFCQGAAGRTNALFDPLPFAAAKGEMLTLRIPDLNEDRIVNRGAWLVREPNGLYLAGATYDRDRLDTIPTAAGRAEIEVRLREFLRLPFEVIDHVAGIRPILDDRKPLLGRHPRFDSVAFFNGLGSKGSLQAPYFAEQLANELCGTGTIDADVDLRLWKRRT